MRHPMEYLQCIHGRGATAVTDSNRSARAWMPRVRRARSAPDVPSAPLGSARKDTTGTYDAVDLRLMDTFPASDAVARY
jgi:hypothetical protein